MGRITDEFIEEQIGYLKTDHEFYIAWDEFDGDEDDLPELRVRLRRAAKAAGMRVHTRLYDDDAVWVFDPDWKPSPEELAAHNDQRQRSAQEAIAAHLQEQRAQTPVRHLRALD